MKDKIKRDFISLRRWHIASVVSAVAGIGIMLLFKTHAHLASAWFLVGAILACTGFAFNILFWRCPSCRHNLENKHNPKQCPWCRVTLR